MVCAWEICGRRVGGVGGFYARLLHELEEIVRRPSATAMGAAVVLKGVAKAHGVEIADRLPSPAGVVRNVRTVRTLGDGPEQ
jgi:hypothetical protein